ncbi:hypothetical protein F5X99DRAFT_424772 [Biscogniauxia marginata]|nr:hypothetical protein F5X99DRAFT_424772 [Biscogniauxia marginata]
MAIARFSAMGDTSTRDVRINERCSFIFKTASLLITFVTLAALIGILSTPKLNHPLLGPAENHNLGTHAFRELSTWQLCNLNPTYDAKCAFILTHTAHLPHLTRTSSGSSSSGGISERTEHIFSLSDDGAPLEVKMTRHAGLARAAIAEFEASLPFDLDSAPFRPHQNQHQYQRRDPQDGDAEKQEEKERDRPSSVCAQVRFLDAEVARLLAWEDLFWEWNRGLEEVFPVPPLPNDTYNTSDGDDDGDDGAVEKRKLMIAERTEKGGRIGIGEDQVEETWLLTRLLLAKTYVRVGRNVLVKSGEGYKALLRAYEEEGCGGDGYGDGDGEGAGPVELRAAEDVRRAFGGVGTWKWGVTLPICLILSAVLVRLAALGDAGFGWEMARRRRHPGRPHFDNTRLMVATRRED